MSGCNLVIRSNTTFRSKYMREAMRNRPFTYGFAQILAFLILTVFGLYVGFRGLQQWSLWYWLHENGSLAEATVTNLRVSTGNMLYVEYAFSAENDGRPAIRFEREEVVSRSLYRRLARGAMLEIRYDSGDPTVSRIASNQFPYLLDIIVSLCCILLGVIPTIVLYRLVNYRFEPFTLFRHRLRF